MPKRAAYPLVVRVMLQFKADLLALEALQVAEMTRRWLSMEDFLFGEMESLAAEIKKLRDAGQEIPRSKIVRLARYRSFLAQLSIQLDRYTDYADGVITRGQRDWLALGISHAVESIKAYYATRGRVAGAFNILPVGAIESMVGLAGDGSPLRKLLVASWPDAIDGLTDALIKSTMLGKNPRDTASLMAKRFGVGLDRAMNIARTEQLRVYRTSNLAQYKESGVVRGWKRLSARDTRVCPACLFADDGTIYSLDTPFDEHPQGRCTPVPVVIGMPTVTWQSGITWFTKQSAAAQKDMLGAGAYDAWQNGEFELADMVGRRESEIWGGALITKSLKELTE